MTTLCFAVGGVAIAYFAATGLAAHIYAVVVGVRSIKERLKAPTMPTQTTTQPTSNYIDNFLGRKVGAEAANKDYR